MDRKLKKLNSRVLTLYNNVRTLFLYYRNFFRIIVAAGGTGAVVVNLAEQLNHTNAEVIYLDFSSSSKSIAQKRARIRNLRNIIWVQSWIEGSRFLGLGKFHFSQCSGVLHHLKSPRLGLNTLKNMLTVNGGMEIMVYSAHGRTPIYQIQELLKMINLMTHDMLMELNNANHILSVIPKSHWFMALDDKMRDHKNGDIGVYDLLLNSRDVAYSISTLYKWIPNSGLCLYYIDFLDFTLRNMLNIIHSISDPILYMKIRGLDISKQQSIGDIMSSYIMRHRFYAAHQAKSEATLDDTSNTLYIYGAPHGFRQTLRNKKNQRIYGNLTYFSVKLLRSNIVTESVNSTFLPFGSEMGKQNSIVSTTFYWNVNTFSMFLVKRLLHSNRGINLISIYYEYRKKMNTNISNMELLQLTKQFYVSAKDTGLFLLRNKYVGVFPKTCHVSYFRIESI